MAFRARFQRWRPTAPRFSEHDKIISRIKNAIGEGTLEAGGQAIISLLAREWWDPSDDMTLSLRRWIQHAKAMADGELEDCRAHLRRVKQQ